MSVFGNILDKIFHRQQPGAGAPASTTASTTPAAPTAAPGTGAAGASGTGAAAGQPQAAPGAGAAPAAAPAQPVDVEAVLNAMAQKSGQPLNWRTSIVDLMKLLDLDSSLANRKALAHELGYTGDTNDSATMNIWLHKQVMRKLAENGGKVPADLKD